MAAAAQPQRPLEYIKTSRNKDTLDGNIYTKKGRSTSAVNWQCSEPGAARRECAKEKYIHYLRLPKYYFVCFDNNYMVLL